MTIKNQTSIFARWKSYAIFWLLTAAALLLADYLIASGDNSEGWLYISPIRARCAYVAVAVFCFSVWHARRKGLQIFPPAWVLWILYAFCLLFCCVGNVQIYAAELPCFFVSVFSMMGTVCLLWAVLGRFSLIFWIPFLLVEMLQRGGYEVYNILLSNEVLVFELIKASYSDLLVHLTVYNVAVFVACLFFVCCMGYALSRLMKHTTRLALLSVGLLLLVFSAVVTYVPSVNVPPSYRTYPEQELRMFTQCFRKAWSYNTKVLEYVKALESPAGKPSSISTLKGGEGVVLVIHIGESVRADRLSFNGYFNKGRSTTPWLDSQAGKALINFPDCISSCASTGSAMITLLTDARRDIRYNEDSLYDARTGSVLELFAANHFDVYAYLGTTMMHSGLFDLITRELTKSVKEKYYARGLSWTILPVIDETLKKRNQENLCLFINNEGSHCPFNAYDAASAPFMPQPGEASFNYHGQEDEMNNAYDNTIHYLDGFVRQVVEKLQGRPFVYVYVSDHGEYTGQDGQWFRTNADEYHHTSGCRVGMFVITSPEFDAMHPHFAESVLNLRKHADLTVGHEHLFHTLLGLFGISTPYYNAALDLTTESPEPYTGPQPDKNWK